MSRNRISFIFSLGKHRALKLRPLKQLTAEVEISSSLVPPPLKTHKSPVKIEQVQHSNQMSS